jgi:glyoxylase-like metal-dependent hydrolase (beta-lactamase superfamily II)
MKPIFLALVTPLAPWDPRSLTQETVMTDVTSCRLKVETLVVSFFQTNCYIVYDPQSHDAVVIDPGFLNGKVLPFLEEHGLRLRGIIQTHNHRDHSGASAALQKATGAPIYRHPLQDLTAKQWIGVKQDALIRINVTQGERLTLGTLSFCVYHTPGHEPGSISLLSEAGLFVGDVLFRGSIGRTDLHGGDEQMLLHSIKVTLAQVPDETPVFSGHGPMTTLGQERQHNPFLQ